MFDFHCVINYDCLLLAIRLQNYEKFRTYASNFNKILKNSAKLA